MKPLLALLLVMLLALPAVFAASQSYQRIGEKPLMTRIRTPGNVYNQTVIVPAHFGGLQGIIGQSIPDPERVYGPEKRFGKPAPKRQIGLAKVREGFGVGGIMTGAPGATKGPCSDFNCKQSQSVVGDTTTKAYYRCYCPGAKGIANESVKCIDTPAIAERIGYHAGPC
jgi:hypothetical protein